VYLFPVSLILVKLISGDAHISTYHLIIPDYSGCGRGYQGCAERVVLETAREQVDGSLKAIQDLVSCCATWIPLPIVVAELLADQGVFHRRLMGQGRNPLRSGRDT